MRNLVVSCILLLLPGAAFPQYCNSVRNSNQIALAIMRELQYCGQVYEEFKSENATFLRGLEKSLPEMMQDNDYLYAVLADEALNNTSDWNRPISREECKSLIQGSGYFELVKKHFYEEQRRIEEVKKRLESKTVTIYSIANPAEIALIKKSGYREWLTFIPDRSVFYPISSESQARDLASKSAAESGEAKFVVRLTVRAEFMYYCEVKKFGGGTPTEWWIPAKDIKKLNDNIVGKIEIIGEYR